MFPKSNKKRIYIQSELDKERCGTDSDGHVPGLCVKTVCSESKHLA